MLVQGHSSSSLKGPSSQGRFLGFEGEANVIPVFKKEVVGNFRLISLTSILGKGYGANNPFQTFRTRRCLAAVSMDLQKGDHIFYNVVTGSVDEGRAVDIIATLARLLTLSYDCSRQTNYVWSR